MARNQETPYGHFYGRRASGHGGPASYRTDRDDDRYRDRGHLRHDLDRFGEDDERREFGSYQERYDRDRFIGDRGPDDERRFGGYEGRRREPINALRQDFVGDDDDRDGLRSGGYEGRRPGSDDRGRARHDERRFEYEGPRVMRQARDDHGRFAERDRGRDDEVRFSYEMRRRGEPSDRGRFAGYGDEQRGRRSDERGPSRERIDHDRYEGRRRERGSVRDEHDERVRFLDEDRHDDRRPYDERRLSNRDRFGRPTARGGQDRDERGRFIGDDDGFRGFDDGRDLHDLRRFGGFAGYAPHSDRDDQRRDDARYGRDDERFDGRRPDRDRSSSDPFEVRQPGWAVR